MSALHGKKLKNLIKKIKLIAFDFDGVFTDNCVYVFQNGSEAVKCNRGDGLGLAKLRKLGIETVIISTEPNPVVAARSKKLKIPCLHGVDNKESALKEILRKKNISFSQAAFAGNDINDLTCLKRVALPIVVSDAHPDVIKVAKLKTKTAGGCGAVREICELFKAVLNNKNNGKRPVQRKR